MIRLRQPTKEEATLGDITRKRAVLQIGQLRWHLTLEEVLKLRTDCNVFVALALKAKKEK